MHLLESGDVLGLDELEDEGLLGVVSDRVRMALQDLLLPRLELKQLPGCDLLAQVGLAERRGVDLACIDL